MLSRIMNFLLTMGLTAVLAGCQHLEAEAGKATGARLQTYHTEYFFWGATTATVHVQCSKGIYRIYEGYSGSDVALTLVTLGIYSPRTMKVVCAR